MSKPEYQIYHSREAHAEARKLIDEVRGTYKTELADLLQNLHSRLLCAEGQCEVLLQGVMWTKDSTLRYGHLQNRVNELSEKQGLAELPVPEWVARLGQAPPEEFKPKAERWVTQLRVLNDDETPGDVVSRTFTLPVAGSPRREEALAEIRQVLALEGLRLVEEEPAPVE